MNLTPAEKETIILTSEADDTASVYTFDVRLKRKLERLHKLFPDKIHPINEEKYGAVNYTVPKTCIVIYPAAYGRMEKESKRTCKDNGI